MNKMIPVSVWFCMRYVLLSSLSLFKTVFYWDIVDEQPVCKMDPKIADTQVKKGWHLHEIFELLSSSL